MLQPLHRYFFTLLRAGLWPELSNMRPDFDKLTEQQWEGIYALAISQTVEAIVYDGVLALDKVLLPPAALLLKWTVRVDALERRNQQMSMIIAQTSRLFKQKDLDVQLLKGHALADCYHNPLHRNSGDVDYYFADKTAFREVNKLLISHQIKVHPGALNSAYYRWKGYDMEHHTHLFDLVNPLSKGYLANLVKIEKAHRQELTFDQVKVTILSPVLTHIHTNAHLLKHFIGYGIGLRQFCDMARVCYTYHQDLQGEKGDLLKKSYKKLGIYDWSELLYKFLQDQLGLPEEYLPFELKNNKNTDWLAIDVLQGGNFGFFENELSDKSWKIEKVGSQGLLIKRFLRHFSKALIYAPGETIAFAFSKIANSLTIKKIT